VALQHSVWQLGRAFQNFFNSCKGKRKGQRVKLPRFKKKSNQQTATFMKVGFSLRPNGGVRLAKPIGVVNPIWTRPLPSAPSSVFELFSHMPQQARVLKKFKTVIKDCASRYFLSFVVEVEPEQMPAQEPSVLNPEASRLAGARELKGLKVGIDLGIKTFATLSTGEKIQSPD